MQYCAYHLLPSRRPEDEPSTIRNQLGLQGRWIDYLDERRIPCAPSRTLLEAALEHGIPHLHACGGNARCSTCRVLVVHGAENLLPRTEAEEALARRKGLGSEVRLACQARANGDVRVRRLVRDAADAGLTVSQAHASTGRETQLCVLFSDLRGFTQYASHALPYDVVHVLNRYFAAMGDVVLRHGGRIDKYIGDGMMAVFEAVAPDTEARVCLAAVAAALEMQAELGELNGRLQPEFGVAWKMGIGIHFGPAVVGEVGHPDHVQFTALGDTVNVASRIEGVTKLHSVGLLISEEVFQRVQGSVVTEPPLQTRLRGRGGETRLHPVLELSPDALSPECLETQLRRDLLKAIPRHLAPGFLRLAFHDFADFNPATGTGGADGSIRFPEILARPENRGLDQVIAALVPVKQRHPEVSWADLIALAGAVAVQRTGGPWIDLPLGRPDASAPPPAPRIPTEQSGLSEQQAWFHSLGFSDQEMVALLGAHTLGVAHQVPMTMDPFTFDNSLFRALVLGGSFAQTLLPSDRSLLNSPETRDWVTRFALDQASFFQVFQSAYRRLTLLGVPESVVPGQPAFYRPE